MSARFSLASVSSSILHVMRGVSGSSKECRGEDHSPLPPVFVGTGASSLAWMATSKVQTILETDGRSLRRVCLSILIYATSR